MSKTILKSNNIFVEKGKIIDGFVVMEGNRLYDVQPIEKMDEYKDQAILIDYGDQTILPAFHDAHIHLILAAIVEKGGDLRNASSEEEAAAFFYEKNKDSNDKWLLGGAWDHFKWAGAQLPNRKTLDQYFPDKLVLLLNREIHGAWTNTKTLNYLGIDKHTPDPEFGKFYRDEDGTPTGYLHEYAAYNALRKILGEMDHAKLAEYVKILTETAHRNGVTAVSDVQVGEVMPYNVYDEMEKNGELNLRIHYSPPIKLDNKTLLDLKERHTGDRLRFSGTKAFMDGTAAGHTAMMISPYLDEPDNTGCPSINLDYLKERITELDAMGIRTRIHACGDLSVKLALDYFENARRINGNTGTRHTIEHIEVAAPDDLERFGPLGVIASVQPDHMPRYDFYHHPFHTILGEDRMKYSWPFHSIQKAGGRLAFGTDNPCVGINPMPNVFRAVNRVSDQFEPAGGFNPAEKLDLQTVLDAYTMGPAYTNSRENELGALKTGYLADLVVLDQNIFKMKPEDLKTFQIAATYFDGKKVFEKKQSI